MKSLRLPLALTLGLFAGGVLAQGADLNTITAVRVNGGTIEITGTKKPNFTTFTMTDPPRLVIDISEAIFSGVEEEQQVGNGTVTAIKTASYGSDESAIARVLIGFERDVETDIQSADNKLVVKVVGGGGAAVAQADPQPAAQEPAARQQPQPQQQLQPPAEKPAAVTEITPSDQPDPEAVREAQRRAEEERKEQERQAREAAEKAEQERLAQEREAREAAERAKQELASAEKAARDQQERDAQAARDAEKAAAAERARLAQEEKQRQREEAQAKTQQEQEEREAARQAEAEERKQKAEQDRLAREEKRRAAEEERLAAAEEKKRAREERLAMARQERDTRSEGGEAISTSGRPKTVSLVGFRQDPSVSRVFVRTNEPVSYTVREAGGNTLVLELENTRIGAENNARFLDTSYFDTPVAMVDPNPGPTRTVLVEIKLKEKVPYEAKQDGNEVVLEFPRPARP